MDRSNVTKPVSGELYQSLKAGWGSLMDSEFLAITKTVVNKWNTETGFDTIQIIKTNLKAEIFVFFLNHFNF